MTQDGDGESHGRQTAARTRPGGSPPDFFFCGQDDERPGRLPGQDDGGQRFGGRRSHKTKLQANDREPAPVGIEGNGARFAETMPDWKTAIA